MLKNTVIGSALAKLLPGVAKVFLENASQDEVVQAEQAAAVLHQQLQAAEAARTAGLPTEPTDVAVAAVTTAEPVVNLDLAALTQRAEDAEANVGTLTTQLAQAVAERDQYKGWYDKQATAGTKLPGADASTRTGAAEAEAKLSQADAYALSLVRGR